MIKAVVLVTLAVAANCALLPTNGLVAPRQALFQPAKPYYFNHHQQRFVPISADANAQTLRSDAVVNPDSFQYAYETSNGIQAQEQGQLKHVGKDAAVATQGQFSWTSPEGTPVQISYVADESGYHPVGSALPTPPPVPPQIARLVEYLKRVNAQPQQPAFFKRF